MKRRTLFQAGALLAIAPWFVPTEKYKLLIYLHPIKNFKTAKIVHPGTAWPWTRVPHGTTVVCPFSIDRHGNGLSERKAEQSDPDLVIGNAKEKAWSFIHSVAEQSYELFPRKIVRVDLVVEADHSGKDAHVRRLSVTSHADNRPFVFNEYTPPPPWAKAMLDEEIRRRSV